MNIDRRIAAGAALALLASACTPTDITFGNAVRTTMAAQVVDPDPQYDGPQTTDGTKAAEAVKRYQTDTVKKPDSVRTTEKLSGGGSPK